MLARSNFGSRGDTLIEVLFAIAIFSLVAVGGLAIMNQGTATSQRALEITLVRNEIDAQAETLRFLNASFVGAFQQDGDYPLTTPAGQWYSMLKEIEITGNVSATPFGMINSECPDHPTGSFILNAHNATFVSLLPNKIKSAQTFSQVRYDAGGEVSSAEGIWIEAVRSKNSVDPNQSNFGYIDFHIRACWDSPGQSIPVTIGTIVRLYEPR